MATYTAPTSHRMAYDADGTWCGVRNRSTGDPWAELTQTTRNELNDEDTPAAIDIFSGTYGLSAGNGQLIDLVFVFPELRDVDAWYWCNRTTDTNRVGATQTSADTTNGIDGSWTDIENPQTPTTTSTGTGYRSDITTAGHTSKRSFRVYGFSRSGETGRYLESCHVYGEISSGETPDRLLWIDDTTGLEFTAVKDWGDITASTSTDITVQLKNNSSTLTANTIGIDASDLYDGSSSWYTFDYGDTGTFTTSESISSLAAATTSSDLVIRQTTGSTIGVFSARLYASVTSWT